MTKDIAVVGMGYWGKNLARNFHELGALHTICDTSPAVEKEWKAKFPEVRFTQDFGHVLADPGIDAVRQEWPPHARPGPQKKPSGSVCKIP